MDISSERSKKYLRTALFVGVGILLIVTIFFIITLRSLPGQSLYGFKVNTLEETLELMTGSPKNKAEYHVALLERRFSEMERLAAKDQIAEGDLTYFAAEVDERLRELIAHLAAETGLGITLRESLDIASAASVYLQGIERLSENHEHLLVVEESLEDSSREARGLYETQVEQFSVRASEEEVREYIAVLLGDVLARVEQGNLSNKIKDDAGTLIERAQRNIIAGRGVTAIVRINEALRLIKVADLLGTASIEPERPQRQEQNASSTDESATTSEESVVSGEAVMIGNEESATTTP